MNPLITKQQLSQIDYYISESLLDTIIDELNDTLNGYGINTSLRICHFLAQVIHESGSFQYTEEIADGSAYEGRLDLGNTQKGDGVLFKGRGWIQVTGRSNYKSFGDSVAQDFISMPQLVANMPFCAWGAGWFWDLHKLNDIADKDDLLSITKVINGGENGLSSRQMWLLNAKKILMP